MKTHILLIGRHNDELLVIHKELAAYKTLNVEAVTNSRVAIERIRNTIVDLVIFNLDKFSQEKIRLATDLRELGFTFPVLILAEKVSKEMFQEVSRQNGMVIVEKPFDWRTAQGLIRKFSKGTEVKQQIARRYRTDQIASIESMRADAAIPSRIKNLSSTGAFFEFIDGSLRLGEILRLSVLLNDLKTTRAVTAQVVWMPKRNPMTGRAGAGVRFIGSGEVYQMMLQETGR